MSPVMDAMHVMPRGDLVAHTPARDCVCGPETRVVTDGGVPVALVVLHPSLDGRELREDTE